MLGKTNVKVKPNKKIGYVEYIESTGTQFIDTGFKPNQNTRVELKFSSSETNKGFFGCNTSTKGFVFYEENGYYKYKYNADGTASSVAHSNEDLTIIIDKNNVYLNGNNIITATSSTFSTDYNAYIFGWNQEGILKNPCSMKLYYCKIYDGDILVRNFKPCKDGAGVYCLYDEVEKRYYYNQGTGEFRGEGYFERDLTVTRSILDQGSFLNVTPTYLTNQVDGSDGFTIVGRANLSNSDWGIYKIKWLQWAFTIDLTKYNTISFYAKKNANHGMIYCKVIDDIIDGSNTNAQIQVGYSSAPTEWTEYTLDVQNITGTKNVIFIGGFLDNSGNTTSSTSYCNIKFLTT